MAENLPEYATELKEISKECSERLKILKSLDRKLPPIINLEDLRYYFSLKLPFLQLPSKLESLLSFVINKKNDDDQLKHLLLALYKFSRDEKELKKYFVFMVMLTHEANLNALNNKKKEKHKALLPFLKNIPERAFLEKHFLHKLPGKYIPLVNKINFSFMRFLFMMFCAFSMIYPSISTATKINAKLNRTKLLSMFGSLFLYQSEMGIYNVMFNVVTFYWFWQCILSFFTLFRNTLNPRAHYTHVFLRAIINIFYVIIISACVYHGASSCFGSQKLTKETFSTLIRSVQKEVPGIGEETTNSILNNTSDFVFGLFANFTELPLAIPQNFLTKYNLAYTPNNSEKLTRLRQLRNRVFSNMNHAVKNSKKPPNTANPIRFNAKKLEELTTFKNLYQHIKKKPDGVAARNFMAEIKPDEIKKYKTYVHRRNLEKQLDRATINEVRKIFENKKNSGETLTDQNKLLNKQRQQSENLQSLMKRFNSQKKQFKNQNKATQHKYQTHTSYHAIVVIQKQINACLATNAYLDKRRIPYTIATTVTNRYNDFFNSMLEAANLPKKIDYSIDKVDGKHIPTWLSKKTNQIITALEQANQHIVLYPFVKISYVIVNELSPILNNTKSNFDRKDKFRQALKPGSSASNSIFQMQGLIGTTLHWFNDHPFSFNFNSIATNANFIKERNDHIDNIADHFIKPHDVYTYVIEENVKRLRTKLYEQIGSITSLRKNPEYAPYWDTLYGDGDMEDFKNMK